MILDLVRIANERLVKASRGASRPVRFDLEEDLRREPRLVVTVAGGRLKHRTTGHKG